MGKFTKKPEVIEAITFEELVEYGIKSVGRFYNGMPWSFQYKGHPVTHENDRCYLITTSEGRTFNITPQHMIITSDNGEISICNKEIFEKTYQRTSNTRLFAEMELKVLVDSATDPANRPIIEPFIPEILALADKFGHSGQSGGSAPYTASAIASAVNSILLQEPICSITGIDEEWIDVAEMNGGEKLWQNSRCHGLFKYPDGKVSYVDAIIKKTQNGNCYSGGFWLSKEDYLTGNKDLKISNRLYVKSFPFVPKTFYIDVIEEEVAPDDWEMYLKDENQLLEVFEYYDKKILNETT